MYIICFANSRHHRQHLQIYWNSSNILFHSFGFLTVYLGDLIDFLCPYYETGYSNIEIEYNTLYLVNEYDYFHCNTTNYNPLLKCHKPFDTQRLIYTLSISKYLPYPNLPEFDDGQFYYFISTSSGQLKNIDQRYDGLCQTKNMKLILNVQKYSRDYYKEQRRRPTPIIAKRTNLTFLDLNQRFFSSTSFSSTPTSRNISLTLMLLVFCLLTKSKT
jgi:hypothetical protein